MFVGHMNVEEERVEDKRYYDETLIWGLGGSLGRSTFSDTDPKVHMDSGRWWTADGEPVQ